MANSYFEFKQFRIDQDQCAMKVTTDACVFGAWTVECLRNQLEQPERILDIGAGTGLLSLMIAQSITAASIEAIEIDRDTASQAQENARRSEWSGRIKIHQLDFLEWTSHLPYDVVVSNPPFYEQELSGPDKKKNQAHHDESLPFSKLISRIKEYLQDDGLFYLLLPAKGFEQRSKMITRAGLHIYKQAAFHHSERHATSRFFLEGGKRSSKQIQSEEILLQDPHGMYTERIRELLREYYLAL